MEYIEQAKQMNWGYIAGFFDGEGSIVTNVNGNGHGIRISITNTHLPTMQAIEQFLNRQGITGLLVIKPPAQGRKACWHWRSSNRFAIIGFLNAILPFSITKHDKAVDTLNWLGEFQDPKKFFTTAQMQQIRQLLLEGVTNKDVAKIMGVSHCKIDNIRRASLGIPTRYRQGKKGKPLSIEIRARMAEAQLRRFDEVRG